MWTFILCSDYFPFTWLFCTASHGATSIPGGPVVDDNWFISSDTSPVLFMFHEVVCMNCSLGVITDCVWDLTGIWLSMTERGICLWFCWWLMFDPLNVGLSVILVMNRGWSTQCGTCLWYWSWLVAGLLNVVFVCDIGHDSWLAHSMWDLSVILLMARVWSSQSGTCVWSDRF